VTEKAPAFQFYPKDYQTDGKVRMMSWEARGVYVDLLCTYWLEGTLPADPKRLANMVGMTPRRFEKLWPQIAPCFEIDGESLKQKRLIREREKQKAYSEKQSENGKKGAKSNETNRAGKPTPKPNEGHGEAKPEPKPSFPFASPTTTQSIPPSPSVDSQAETAPRSDADADRSRLREALQDLRRRQHAFAEKTDQQILDCAVFHAPTGPVRIDTCANVMLLRATTGKVRGYGHAKARKSNVPGWDRGEDHAVSDEEATAWDPRLGPRPDSPAETRLQAAS